MDAQPLTNEQLSTRVNQPSSGTYGEQKTLQDLKSSLPQSAAPAPGGPGGPGGAPPGLPLSPDPARPGPPQREGRPPTGAALPPGIPSPILAPTDQPGVPVSTPLVSQIQQPAMPVTSAQRRLQILDALASDPNVSSDTREWAIGVRRVLLGA